MSKWDLTGFYPGLYIHNQLHVIKPSASVTIHDMIGYFPKSGLKFGGK